jgi:NhaA family Na+:H+ antiporter
VTQWRNPDGVTELVMWGDYECPDTHEAWRTVERLLERFGDRLRLGWRHYPVPRLHPHAPAAAEVAEAAAAQGGFWDLHSRLFAHQDEELEEAHLLAHVREAGLDADRAARELAEHVHEPAVRADKEAGKAIGLRRTPTFVANGEKWDGFYDLETLTELLS